MTRNIDPTSFIVPNWCVPDGVHAVMTTRRSPFDVQINAPARGAYGDFNLATHVGDDHAGVERNRSLLCDALKLPASPVWLEQVHSNHIVNANCPNALNAKVDGSFSAEKNTVCAIMTADCLPVLLCTADGQQIAAVHAGWRGLASGIISNTIAALHTREVIVWLGAAIGPACFEVGREVRDIFIQKSADYALAFEAQANEKWLADIYHLARIELKQLSIDNIYGGEFCTLRNAEHFYSYRRDGQTGRMATLIWRT